MMTPAEISALVDRARRVRMSVVEMHHRAQTGHVGGALSCVDMLVACYAQPTTRVILSKGHAASALYAAQGVLDGITLADFNRAGSHLPEQPSPHGYATEWATGSLGHGLSVGLGMALADTMRGAPTRTAVILSDGECQEGSVWEAAMLASALNVTNIVALVDYNGLQAIGPSRPFGTPHHLLRRFDGFGWTPLLVDGTSPNRMAEIVQALQPTGQRMALIVTTLKGLGISFMQDDNNWHYRHPSAEDVERARQELGL